MELDDNVGQEKFYLIASAKRLKELENLFGSYDSAEEVKKPESIENIIKEIKQLRKQHKKFTIEAERPIASTGSVRAHIAAEGSKFSGLDKLAVEFTAKDFFCKNLYNRS